jgi:hypothetical protein
MKEKDFSQSFDAVDWAKAFMKIVIDGDVRIDEALMVAWFANAIMRGYDYRDAEVRAALA